VSNDPRFVVKQGKDVGRYDVAIMCVTQSDAQRLAQELNAAPHWREKRWGQGPIALAYWFVVDTQPPDEWNPNDLVSARRDAGREDPTAAELAADRAKFEAEQSKSEPEIIDQLDDARGKLNALDALQRAVLDAMEAAVDAHPGLTRKASGPGTSDRTAEIIFGRRGYTVALGVTSSGPRADRVMRINGSGETIDVAVAAFLDSLDAWAEVLK
jgi:hypothetical protein